MTPLQNNPSLSQLSKHPIFAGLTVQELEQLITKCKVKNFNRMEKVLHSKTSREGLMLLLDGMVEVYVEGVYSAQEEILEVLQKGDIIGLSSLADFLGEPTHHVTEHNVGVRTIEETVCLDIPFSVLEKRWQESQVRDYILRQISVRLKDVYSSLAEQVHLARQFGESEAFIRRIQDIMTSPAISVDHHTSIHEVAKIMVAKSISSVTIIKEDKLVGIITESDLVNRLIVDDTSIVATKQAVEAFMTPNPYTISRHAYYYEALSMFLTNQFKHLPVTDDGQVVGMITLSDLLRKKNRGMLEILQTIEKSTYSNLSEIKQAISYVLSSLLHDGLPITHTLEVLTKLYDRLVKHCIELSLRELEKNGKEAPTVSFCWFQMGSAGRKEQFLLTDQDHFLVYEDVDHLSKSEQKLVHDYFTTLTHEIVTHLEKAGFARCKGKMMASEPEWRGTLTRWRERLRSWTLRATNENLLLAHNFFSFRYLYGDDLLYEKFIMTVKEQLSKSNIFFYRLAALQKENPVPTLGQPIRSLFRLGKKSIDLKKEALFPFHHSLELLALQHGIVEGTPMERIQKLKELHSLDPSFAEDLLSAYSCLMKLRVEQGWWRYQRQESTSELPFSHLRSSQKEELIRALKDVRSLQNQAIGSFGF